MQNNQVLRRLRYIFSFNDQQMMSLFASGNYPATRAEVSSWLKKEEDAGYEELSDPMLATFLNGLINEKRGKKEGPQPAPEMVLNNNIILRKLKIALNLKDTDLLGILALAGRKISKHELSAFFRKPTQPQYRECQDQILRNLLQGMEVKYGGQLID